MYTHVSMLDALPVMYAQAGVDVSKHGGHAYPGMEDVYNVELQHMAGDDVMTDVPDHKFHGSSGMDYPGSYNSKLQSQVTFISHFVGQDKLLFYRPDLHQVQTCIDRSCSCLHDRTHHVDIVHNY